MLARMKRRPRLSDFSPATLRRHLHTITATFGTNCATARAYRRALAVAIKRESRKGGAA